LADGVQVYIRGVEETEWRSTLSELSGGQVGALLFVVWCVSVSEHVRVCGRERERACVCFSLSLSLSSVVGSPSIWDY
jgi:hypothetical protein